MQGGGSASEKSNNIIHHPNNWVKDKSHTVISVDAKSSLEKSDTLPW